MSKAYIISPVDCRMMSTFDTTPKELNRISKSFSLISLERPPMYTRFSNISITGEETFKSDITEIKKDQMDFRGSYRMIIDNYNFSICKQQVIFSIDHHDIMHKTKKKFFIYIDSIDLLFYARLYSLKPSLKTANII